ncbi:MAG: hypothetical protein ACOZNI_04870 [Myxococcota bacterium]
MWHRPRRGAPVSVTSGPTEAAIPALLHLGHVAPPALAELLARADAARRGAAPRLATASPVALVCAEPAPYLRAEVEAGAALLGLRVIVYGPAEARALGDAGVAGRRFGALHAAVLASGMPAAAMEQLAGGAACPVVEAGGAGGDPAGAIADLRVLTQALGGLASRKLAWVGDACGLLHDLMVAGAGQGLSVAVAHPIGYAPDAERVTWARERAAVTGASVHVGTELAEALADANAVYAEPWPDGAADRFRPYAVQRHALRGTRTGPVILHRAPERRGAELSPAIVEDLGWLAAEQSRARADAWAAILGWLLDPDPLRSVVRFT